MDFSFFARPKNELRKDALVLFAYEITFSQDGSLLVFTSGLRGSTSFPTLAQIISFNGKEADRDFSRD